MFGLGEMASGLYGQNTPTDIYHRRMIRPPNEKAEKFPVNALLELPSERYRSFFTKADASANNLQLSNAVNPAGFSIFISIPSRMPTVTPAIEVF